MVGVPNLDNYKFVILKKNISIVFLLMIMRFFGDLCLDFDNKGY